MTAPYAVLTGRVLDVVVLFMVLAVLGVVFGVAVVLTGRAEGMSEEGQDLADTGIPRDRAMTPQDVIGLRFALAFRGYRMAEVDDALDRLAAELAARDEAIARLRAGTSGTPDPEPRPEQPWAEQEEAPVSAYVPSDATGDVPSGTPVEQPPADPWPSSGDTPAAADYIPSDATGDLPDGVESEVTPAPDAEVPLPDQPEFVAPLAEAGDDEPVGVVDAPPAEPVTFAEPEPAPEPAAEPEPEPARPARSESPIFGALAGDGPSPFRPEVPEIAYDPWAVTPRSRYTDGPEYVEVEHDDDPDPTEAIAEHQTGYAPAPPAEPPGDEDEPPRSWPS